MRLRIRKTGIGLAAAILCGLIYAAFIKLTGLAMPCFFYRLTGLQCPGCGVTSMCMALLRRDFEQAFYSNQMLFMLTPVLLFLFGSCILEYLKNGVFTMSRYQTMLAYVCIGLLLIFGIYRNLCGWLAG